MQDWFRDRFRAGTPTKNVNTMAPLLTLAYLYEETGDKTYLPYLDTWAEWVMHDMPRTEEGGLQHIVFNSENPQQLWDDTLMMCVLPLAQHRHSCSTARSTSKKRASSSCCTSSICYDRRTGSVVSRLDVRRPAQLCRGAAGRAATAGSRSRFPNSSRCSTCRRRSRCASSCSRHLRRRSDALAQHQDASGLWHTLIDDPSFVSRSVGDGRLRVRHSQVRAQALPAAQHTQRSASSALQGRAREHRDDGELKNVSFGTAMGNDLDFYRRIPLTPMPYGQAMAMLCVWRIPARPHLTHLP